MITVYVKKMSHINESEKQSILASLSQTAHERLTKKRNEKLYLASVCALSLLNNEQRSDIQYTEEGRPYFSNIDSDISISHCQSYVAVALSNSKSVPVGIDIEDILTNMQNSRFFTDSETKIAFDNIKCTEIWTKKEALFKFLKNDSTPFIKLDSTLPKIYKAHFKTIQIENSVLTVCTPENEKTEIIQK